MSPDVAASVRARLLNQAKAAREEFERTLVRYADERLLYRLGASAARERCVLKGASLLTAWMHDPYRATRDVDLLATGSPDAASIRDILDEICAVSCPADGLRFDLTDLLIEEIRTGQEYAGQRARFVAYLGAARIRIQVDFGYGDALVDGARDLEYPTMLAGLPAPRVRAYPREATVAEKFHAMVTLDTRNSRMKDFHDMWALSGAFAFVGPALRQAVAACFARRGTAWDAEAPRPLAPAFYEMPELQTRWQSYLAGGEVLVAPPAQLDVIGERVIGFLSPVRSSIMSNDSFDQSWAPGGPWTSAPSYAERPS